MIEGIFFLGLILGLITLIGHGIWIVLAKLFRLLSRSTPSHPPSKPQGIEDLTFSEQNTIARQVVNRLVATGRLDAQVAETLHAALRKQPLKSPIATTSPPLQHPIAAEFPLPRPPLEDEDKGVLFPKPPLPHKREIPKSRPPSTPPPPPRRSFREAITAFFESSNMRWGEITGGLLVVLSSLALVLSFWNEIHAFPVLKVTMIAGLNFALFVAGLYIHRSWKLPRASQALLSVTLLLTPITLLTTRTLDDWPIFGLLVFVIALTGALAFVAQWAGNTLFGSGGIRLAAGLIMPSLVLLIQSQLPIPAWTGIWLLPAALIFLSGVVWPMKALPSVLLRLGFFGIQCFGAGIVVMFVLARLLSTMLDVAALAPILALLSLPWMWMACREKSLCLETRTRWTSTLLALTGVAILFSAHSVAIHQPLLLAITSAIACSAITLMAWHYRLAILLPPVNALLLLSWLSVAQVLQGGSNPLESLMEWFRPELWASTVPLALIWSSIAWWTGTRKRQASAIFTWSMAGVALGVLATAIFHFRIPLSLFTWSISMVAMATGLAFAVFRSKQLRATEGCWMLLIAAWWHPEWDAALAVSVTAAILLGLSLIPIARRSLGPLLALWRSRVIPLALATPLIIFWQGASASHWAAIFAILALTLGVLAWLRHRGWIWLLAESAFAVSITMAAWAWVPEDGIARIATTGVGWASLASVITAISLISTNHSRLLQLHRRATDTIAQVLAYASALGWNLTLCRFWIIEGELMPPEAWWMSGWLASLVWWHLRSKVRNSLTVHVAALLILSAAVWLALIFVPSNQTASGLAWIIGLGSVLSFALTPRSPAPACWEPKVRTATAVWAWTLLLAIQLGRYLNGGNALIHWSNSLDLSAPLILVWCAWILNAWRACSAQTLALSVGYLIPVVWLFLFPEYIAPTWNDLQILAMWNMLILSGYAWWFSHWNPSNIDWKYRFGWGVLGIGGVFWLSLDFAAYANPYELPLDSQLIILATFSVGALAMGTWVTRRSFTNRWNIAVLTLAAVSLLAHAAGNTLGSGWLILQILLGGNITLMAVLAMAHRLVPARIGMHLGSVILLLLALRLILAFPDTWLFPIIALVAGAWSWVEFANRTRWSKGTIPATVLFQVAVFLWWWCSSAIDSSVSSLPDVFTWLVIAAAGQAVLHLAWTWRIGELTRIYTTHSNTGVWIIASTSAIVEWISILAGWNFSAFALERILALGVIILSTVTQSRRISLEHLLILGPALASEFIPEAWMILFGSSWAAAITGADRWRNRTTHLFALAVTISAALHTFIFSKDWFAHAQWDWIARELVALTIVLAAGKWRLGLVIGLAFFFVGFWPPETWSILMILGLAISAAAALTPLRDRHWQLAVFCGAGLYILAQIGFALAARRPVWPEGAVVIVAIGLLILIVQLLRSAGSTPSHVSDAVRFARYQIYGAELILLFAIAHMRLAAPHWFGTWLNAIWPFAIYALALAGIGSAEWLAKRGNMIFPEPLRKSGFLLPLIPLLGAWANHSSSTMQWSLFIGAILYAGLSITRRSVWLTAAAGIFLNAGYWTLLMGKPSVSFWQHPQVWLVPLALAWLVTIQIHRHSIAPALLLPLRSCALGMLYLSSTADLLIHGIGRSAGLSLLLAVFAVAGVGVGMLFRIKSFLLTGVIFLSVAMTTLMWSAITEIGWHWIWAAAGIALGLGIIGVLAWMEKNRAALQAWFDRFHQWEP